LKGRKIPEFSFKPLRECSYTAGSIMFRLHTHNTTLKALQEQLLKDKLYLRKDNREAMQIIPN